MDVFEVSLSIPFNTYENAQIAHKVLSVDKEPRRSTTRKELFIDQQNLIVKLFGSDPRNLRVAASSVIKHVMLIIKSIDKMDRL